MNQDLLKFFYEQIDEIKERKETLEWFKLTPKQLEEKEVNFFWETVFWLFCIALCATPLGIILYKNKDAVESLHWFFLLIFLFITGFGLWFYFLQIRNSWISLKWDQNNQKRLKDFEENLNSKLEVNSLLREQIKQAKQSGFADKEIDCIVALFKAQSRTGKSNLLEWGDFCQKEFNKKEWGDFCQKEFNKKVKTKTKETPPVVNPDPKKAIKVKKDGIKGQSAAGSMVVW